MEYHKCIMNDYDEPRTVIYFKRRSFCLKSLDGKKWIEVKVKNKYGQDISVRNVKPQGYNNYSFMKEDEIYEEGLLLRVNEAFCTKLGCTGCNSITGLTGILKNIAGLCQQLADAGCELYQLECPDCYFGINLPFKPIR